METTHRINPSNASTMSDLESESVELVVTSPPYPMIEMWDEAFGNQSPAVRKALERNDGTEAFELMHRTLDPVWDELERVVKPSGIVCVNVGDATRKVGDTFRQFPNHVRVVDYFTELSFDALPDVLWRKPTNSANKFMGSGMIPPNAYVTLEHEYILIFRKQGGPRRMETDSERRYKSAYFWEERNRWFSDLWDKITGSYQELIGSELRDRAASYPLEIPYRLINMFSVQGDTVLDPFWGTGTTSLAAIISARNSIGYELDENFIDVFENQLDSIKELNNQLNSSRLRDHAEFVQSARESGSTFKYNNDPYDTPVKTKQERELQFWRVNDCKVTDNTYTIGHERWNPDTADSNP